jgi:hypothetical protein
MDDGPSTVRVTVSTQVHRLPGEQHASQPRIPTLKHLRDVIIFHIMCYDPMSKDHPLDGYAHLENVCVKKVQGKKSFFASVERRGGIAPGDAQKATVNVLTFDAFPLLMPTKVDGKSTKPAAKFIEICGGAQQAKALLQLHVKRIKVIFYIWALAHGELPKAASWGENALALVKTLDGDVHLLCHHMHPHKGFMIYTGNWAGLNYAKHIEGSDECLTAMAHKLGMTVTSADGTVRYWRMFIKNEAAADEGGDRNWEKSVARSDALAAACKAEHGVEEWWRFYTKTDGPSKRWGVGFHRPSWRARVVLKTDNVQLHLATCEFEDDAGLVADFALVALDREPKNFPEFWNSIKAWVEADENGNVPAVAPVELLGDVRMNPVRPRDATTVADMAAAEDKIAAAATNPELRPLYFTELSKVSGAEWSFAKALALEKRDIKTVGDLALASVDEEKYVRAVSAAKDFRKARAFFWKLKRAAAARLDVELVEKPPPPTKQSALTRERPPEHQRVPDGVANRFVPWLIG